MWNKNTIEWIDIELTSFCNIKCPGCLRQEMYDKVGPLLNKSYIKFEDLKKWIPKGYLPNLKIINFCGSVDEPRFKKMDSERIFTQFENYKFLWISR